MSDRQPLTVDEVLDTVLIGMYMHDPDGNFVPLDDRHNVLRNEAKQQLHALMAGVIGEKPGLPITYTVQQHLDCKAKEQLYTEQRQRLDAVFNGEEV